MAIRWYVMSMTPGAYRGPKYLLHRGNPTGLAVRWAAMDYGLMDVCVCWADTTTAQNTELVANNDCKFVCTAANLDVLITPAQVANVRAGLEQLKIPGNWVATTDTWRVVLRTTCALFQFAQRLHGRFGVPLVPDGYTLNSTWSEIPAQGRQFLADVADELNIDTSGATGSTTLRQIYKVFADAWGAQPIYIGGVEL